MAFIFVIVLGLFSAFLAGNVASDKGHDGTLWFLAGLLLGPLGLIAAAGLSDRHLPRKIREIFERQRALTTKPTWSFIAPYKANQHQVFEQLVKLLKENDETLKENHSSELIGRIDTEKLKINSHQFGTEKLIVQNKNGETLALVTSYASLPAGILWQVKLTCDGMTADCYRNQ